MIVRWPREYWMRPAFCSVPAAMVRLLTVAVPVIVTVVPAVARAMAL